jgi:hydroxymethylpyrimidine/phosphomethylpyrimidine kinase
MTNAIPPLGRAPARSRVLSIAGTDPSGGAGLMADLRTMAALGAYGMGVVTNVVAQNTQGVRAVAPMAADLVTAQLEAISDDVAIDGIKIGMLGNASIIAAVREWLEGFGAGSNADVGRLGGARPPVVLDPVMISTSGTRLLDSSAETALQELIASGLIDVVTPNIPELAALAGVGTGASVAPDWDAVVDMATAYARRTGARVYAKAGHLAVSADRSDALVTWKDGRAQSVSLPGTLVNTKNTHGTGCTLSSALVTFRASGLSWDEAARQTKTFMNGAIAAADGLDVGHGHGPIDQLWNTTYGAHGTNGMGARA